MFMEALAKSSRRQSATSRTVPPPVGGWNARDALDQMDAKDAVLLDNWFPRTNDVVMRKGRELFATMTAVTGEVETLVELHAGTVRKLVACGSGSIDEVSSGTAVNLDDGFSENAWQHCVFGARLFLVNGTDAPQDYDGTTLTETAWTGPSDITKLINVAAHKSRLYFVEKDTQKFWYGGVGAVTGALTAFDLKYVGNFGGNLIAIGVITRDGGDGGGDDLLALLMSSGEVIVYSGSDPGDATDWALVGVFRVGAPIGYRCLAKVGSDLVAITKDGYVALTQVLPFGRAIRSERGTLSDKISGAVTEAIEDYGGNLGWQVTLYPAGDMMIFNIPRAAGRYDQHVMNTKTGAWCRYRDHPARCWAIYDDELYFGGPDGKILKAETGTDDEADEISATGQTAWNYFGDRGHLKQFTMARPILSAPGSPSVFITLATDFRTPDGTDSLIASTDDEQAVWNEAVWDVAVWGGGDEITAQWKSVTGLGYCASLRLRAASDSLRPAWQSTAFAWKRGAIL